MRALAQSRGAYLRVVKLAPSDVLGHRVIGQ
jgi:hypothetical protein